MERIAVRSRDIAIIGYDPERLTLEIAFRNGGVYHYFGVPEKIYQSLMTATSQGTYFSQFIKEKYRYEKIK